ncbi:pyruvate kinase [Gemmobacter aquatilis]|uniref:pyruvate kinase n=1 Tax=Gemmobacter aquatilis TaxID=933059 RepID=UPI001FDFD971|nr:pyruvate kinase [Gemmobacter aquatilis]
MDQAGESGQAGVGRDIWQPGADVTMAAGQRVAVTALLRDLIALRCDMDLQADRRMAAWAPMLQRAEFGASARNLADWLALRGADLADLQDRLAQLGLSTLGRLDGHVRPSVDAVIAVLAALTGAAPANFPDPATISGGDAVLEARRDALFGGGSTGPGTRIMVTLPGVAADLPDLVLQMAQQGADCFRINCAHDTSEMWAAMIHHIRAAEAVLGRRLPVSMDLGGPKFRIQKLHGDEKERLGEGDTFLILQAGAKAPRGELALRLSHPALAEALVVGSEVSIDDGKLRARVQHVAEGIARLKVTQAPEKGMRLKVEKGVNLPGAHLDVPALTDEDRAALDFVLPHADIVAYSFVQTVADVETLLAEMAVRCDGAPLPALLLKIETPLALRNLPDLIVAAGGRVPVAVMIARGDLAVEIGFDRLSEIQEEILWLCEAAQVPVVWATQVLETLVKEGQATRAEVTDAAMSQRAEAVMLNKGPHAVKAVAFLRGVLGRMERHQHKKRARLGPLGLWRQG